LRRQREKRVPEVAAAGRCYRSRFRERGIMGERGAMGESVVGERAHGEESGGRGS